MARTSSDKSWTRFSEGIKKAVKSRIDANINNTLKTEVSSVARETMKKHIQEDFYDKYSPKVYERREGLGGLIDDNNIVTEVEGTKITIANIAPPAPSIFGTPITSSDPTILTQWIDDGVVDIGDFAPVVSNGQIQTLDEHFAKPSFFEETFRELAGLDIVENIIKDRLNEYLSQGIHLEPKKK